MLVLANVRGMPRSRWSKESRDVRTFPEYLDAIDAEPSSQRRRAPRPHPAAVLRPVRRPTEREATATACEDAGGWRLGAWRPARSGLSPRRARRSMSARSASPWPRRARRPWPDLTELTRADARGATRATSRLPGVRLPLRRSCRAGQAPRPAGLGAASWLQAEPGGGAAPRNGCSRPAARCAPQIACRPIACRSR